jgi:nicotinate dehydrogenase subunit B
MLGPASLERAARLADWQAGLPPGTGRGIGFARYKNLAAYAAAIAEVEVDESVWLLRVWCRAVPVS